MNEQNEIRGDWYEELNRELLEEQERQNQELMADAPVEELTDEDIDNWYRSQQ